MECFNNGMVYNFKTKYTLKLISTSFVWLLFFHENEEQDKNCLLSAYWLVNRNSLDHLVDFCKHLRVNWMFADSRLPLLLCCMHDILNYCTFIKIRC